MKRKIDAIHIILYMKNKQNYCICMFKCLKLGLLVHKSNLLLMYLSFTNAIDDQIQ